MSSVNPHLLLREFGLNITEPRKQILTAFLHRQSILTRKDVLEWCGYKFDRVTIYRTLNLFVKIKIIHIIPSADNLIRYVFLNYTVKESLTDQHLHFSCSACGQLFLLQDQPVPLLHLPKGFVFNEIEVIVKGRCGKCN